MHAGIWKRLYREKSSRDSGTLVQLQNLNHKTVPKDLNNQVHASEDFLKVMCIAHYGCAWSWQLSKSIPDNAQSLSIREKQELLMAVVDKVVSRFVNIHAVDLEADSTDGDILEAPVATTDTINGVHDYAWEVLSLSLLYAEFDDALKEGDTYRVLQFWKLFLLLFKASKRKRIMQWKLLTSLRSSGSSCHLDLPSNWHGHVS